MKKTIFKIVLFITILGLSLFFISKAYNKKEYKKFYEIPKKIKIANIGTSHGHFGFIYDEKLKKNSFNFALPAQPLYYDYKFLEENKSRFEKNSVLIIPISIFSFYQGEKLGTYNDRYSRLMSYKSIFHISIFDYVMSRYFSILIGDNRFFNLIYTGSKKREASNDNKKSLVKGTVNGHLKYSENPNIDKQNLIKILKFCNKNNIKPILITTPVTSAYNEIVTKEIYKEKIYDHIDDVLSKVGFSVQYLDYSHYEKISNNLYCFLDADHLNPAGAKLFTSIVLKEINYKN
ncbi:D-alanyl-lipoteichoic acid biosynthesis protein DltD [Cetobacterium sp.]|uniref:D-alanyl-lipoteichoic acid biosynthesis protein DltD n=1 Tax=Cetobacterium sp. TaxID=2071632 RepID=UPI003F2E1431